MTEKEKSRNLEEEINLLKEYKIPQLKKTIEEKDNYIDSLLVEQIKFQKEVNYLKDNFNENNNQKINLFKYIIPEYQEDKDKLIIYQSNKLDYVNNAYKKIKNDLKEKEEEFQKQISELKIKINTQEEQISTLKGINSENEAKIIDLNKEINVLSEFNRNLSLEITTFNEIITDINNEKENYMLENEFISNSNNLILNRIQRQDEDYKKINYLLEEYKGKLSEVDTKTYIFKVTSIG